MQSYYLPLTSAHIMARAARELPPEQYERILCVLVHWHRTLLRPAVAEYLIEDVLERHGSAELLMEVRTFFAYAESLSRLHWDVRAGTVFEATDIFPPGLPDEQPPASLPHGAMPPPPASLPHGAMPPPRKLPRRR